MVAGSAAADAVKRARRMPSLRVGLHVVLVEGRPILPAAALSHLVDAEGMFRTDMATLGMLIACSRSARRELANEIAAQFEAFQATGLTLDHCNAHKHFHLHPVIGNLLTEIGERFGLRAMRVPLEPAHLLRVIEPESPRIPALLMAPWTLLLRRRVRAAGLLAPDRVFGLQWSGQMSGERLSGLIRHLPDGLSEIYVHPATGPYPGAAPGYRYREELAALLSPQAIAACRETAVQLGGFQDFHVPVLHARALT